ncbi:hypothetical protein [Archangium primigenium]|uniref:hypothetical protein n=1 Tax=[Archangium] primigenium TaxID=2792470 RepID=UPI001EF839F8|nr:hypothetical protein [Archangium primigenium]
MSLPSLAVLSLLSLSSPALADAPPADDLALGTHFSQVLDAHPARPAAVKSTPRATPAVQDQAEAPVPMDEVGVGEVVKLLVQSLTSRNWGLLACALVLGAVWVVRRFLASRVPWLSSDVAGVALSMATAVSMSLVGALKTGTPLTFSLVLGALLTAAGASGLFSWGKKLSSAAKVTAQRAVAASIR